MRLTTLAFVGSPASTRNKTLVSFLSSLFMLVAGHRALGDGCFVFRWDKQTDINEPTQKAIIVYDAGREDLLLQVKYEGPLEEFGWLVPVPTVPTIQKGSMRPFYELSRLTQQQFGGTRMASSRYGLGSGAVESVRVLEIKTVGAYDVAVLSARDASSLEDWLKAHDYSIPPGKQPVIDEYIRNDWYFVAARIQLNGQTSFRQVSASSPKNALSPSQAHATVQRQLSSGELHPLLISFDTPRCIFPLRISSVSGRSSQVSLYVLSAEPLLDKFIFDKAALQARWLKRERDSNEPHRREMARQCLRNAECMGLAWRLDSLSPNEKRGSDGRDWSLPDLESMADESMADFTAEPLDYDFASPPQELLQCLRVQPAQLAQCITTMPRLRNGSWYLTKQVYTFRSEEMHDLVFQEAAPVLEACLPNPEGRVAAEVLAHFHEQAVPILQAACKSSNTIERVNASSALMSLKDARLLETLLALLNDRVPQVRYQAVIAATPIWSEQLIGPLVSLFRDPHPAVRQQASLSLAQHEPASRAPIYVVMLNDHDPNVRSCAFHVAARIDPQAIPRSLLLRQFSSHDLPVVTLALSFFQDAPGTEWPNLAHSHREARLSSAETAPLTTNRLTLVRLMGLKILRQNADAKAIELTLPLLRDKNKLVSNRAFSLLQAVTSQSISQDDVKGWDEWWDKSKASFTPLTSSR